LVAYQLVWPVGSETPATGYGWFGDSDWRQDGYLTNDGVVQGGSELLALATQLHPVSDEGDYAAEIEARFDGTGHFPDKPAAFGLNIRGSSVAVWRAGYVAGQVLILGEPRENADFSFPLLLARATARRAWTPGSDWHTYRFTAKSRTYTLIVDGEQLLTADSDLYADGRSTGIWVDNAVIRIRAYRVYKT